MNSTLTPYLAGWGAVLSLFTFLWSFWKWRREKPRVVVKVEAREDQFGDDDGNGAIHYELRNRGGKPTTVEEIILVQYQNGICGLLRHYQHCENTSVKYRETVKLPVVLKSGEVWKGYSVLSDESRLTKMDKPALIRAGRLFYKIQCAHTDRLLSGKVRLESFKIRL
jgi:hypothetical protein